MYKSLSRFQFFFLVGCVVIALGAFVSLLLYQASSTDSGELPQITVWGTVTPAVFNALNVDGRENAINAVYVQKNEETLYEAYLEASVTRNQPDLLLIPQHRLYEFSGKTYTIPYEVYPRRQFEDTFIAAAEPLMTNAGIEALPLGVDPLVLYWNKRIYTQKNVAQPPRRWQEVYSLLPRFVERDSALNISKAFISFGEVNNVRHVKEILLALIMQTGNPITRYQGNGVAQVSLLPGASTASGATAAVNFFTEFSNPFKNTYTWNRSLPNSQDMFVSENLVNYIGFASEDTELRSKNPNLSYDVALLPQADGERGEVTYGSLFVLAVPGNALRLSAAVQSAAILTSPRVVQSWKDRVMVFQPVHKTILTQPDATSLKKPIFYRSALISQSWIDRDPESTDAIFKDMIQQVTAGTVSVDESVSRTHQRLIDLYR